jgi:hypothetical protein
VAVCITLSLSLPEHKQVQSHPEERIDMIFPSGDRRMGVLRIQMTDDWSVKDFSGMLSGLLQSYDLIEQFQLLSETVDSESRARVREPVWTALYGQHHWPGRDFDDVLKAVSPFTIPLTIKAIHIESPGFVELLGSWNPLKVIGDAIKNWRSENTKRIAIGEKSAIERDKVRAHLAEALFKLIPKEERTQHVQRIPDIVQAVLEPSAKYLHPVISDGRIENARLLGSGPDGRGDGIGEIAIEE